MNLGARVVVAFMVDLLIGDPRRPTHPVVLMGQAIHELELILRPSSPGHGRDDAVNPRREKLMGALLAFVVVAAVYVVSKALLDAVYSLSPIAGGALHIWLLSTTLAARGLADAAGAVHAPLADGDIPQARRALSMIVGRDTCDLSTTEIVRAAVETVAENTSDGVAAPLVFGLIGGAPLALAYKAVNTLDSMVGYKDERYIDFGWASAKLDDVANCIPARITGLFLVAAALIAGKDWRRAWRVMRRDGRKHPSPNSGIGEAAVAGALGVRLGGFNSYRGVVSFRSYMGDEAEPLQPEHIVESVKLMYIASAMTMLTGVAIRIAAFGFSMTKC